VAISRLAVDFLVAGLAGRWHSHFESRTIPNLATR
jgi:hypothetical protein